MFTRCPSCGREIVFTPPENAEFLPDGYRHRLQCPNCGIAIGVKIPKPPPKVIEEINVDNLVNPNNESGLVLVNQDEKKRRKRHRYYRRYEEGQISKSLAMFFFALFFFIWPFIAYGLNALRGGAIPNDVNLYFFDIDPIGFFIKLIEASKNDGTHGVQKIFNEYAGGGTADMLGFLMMVTSAVLLVFMILALVAKKYPRILPMVFSLVIGLISLAVLLWPMFKSLSVPGGIAGFFNGENGIIRTKKLIYIAYPIIGFAQMLCGFIFMRPGDESEE